MKNIYIHASTEITNSYSATQQLQMKGVIKCLHVTVQKKIYKYFMLVV